jgi:hypothetical protein
MSRVSCNDRIVSMCTFTAVFGLLFLASSPRNMLFQRPAKVIRKTRTNAQHFQDLSKISNKCEIPEGKIPETQVRATFLASYPGSAIRLEFQLVQAITGLITTDDTFANGQHNAIAIRTFFPCPEGNLFLGAEEISKTILFLRHPRDALPAYHDILYAAENNLKADPPPRAPLDQWISWRDTVFTLLTRIGSSFRTNSSQIRILDLT